MKTALTARPFKKEMIRYQGWFGAFSRAFLSNASRKGREAIGLKLVHSQRVRHLALTLAREIDLDHGALFLSELCGLFHDIGRLPQFEKYGTFLDAKSEDHALLGVKVLMENQVLKDLKFEERQMVLDAIYVHNKFSIPESFKGLKLTLSKIIRDADKIDIWRVFDEFYKRGRGSSEINLGLLPGDAISSEVMEDFSSGRIVRLENVKNQLDFMIMRLSWLFDINFKASLKIITQRGYIDTILERLSEGKERHLISGKLSRLLEERLGT